MELKYPESYCSCNPARTHWFKPMLGNIWRCKYCWAAKWQPGDWYSALVCSSDVEKLGIQAAYQKWLHYRPRAKRLLLKLEEMRVLRSMMPEEELIKIIAVIVLEREPEVIEEDKELTDERILHPGSVAKRLIIREAFID